MTVDDVIAFAGHEVHLGRRLEVPWLVKSFGDLSGRRILDVAGGDGYWAARLRRRGAEPVSVDLARAKLARGRRLRDAPAIVAGNALRLPFADGAFDGVMSVCALEHFDDGDSALAEMARVVRPGGTLVMSVDALCNAARWPELDAGHRDRYSVRHTYPRGTITPMLERHGFRVERSRYIFRGWAERLYLTVSKRRLAWNAAVPLTPVVAASDRMHADESGSILLVCATRDR
jgi:ubiquinone/menaquinone biosynthesis C-methylase UbiE